MLALDTLFGLPAHPLVVHGAVVLVPLTAVGAVAMAVSPRVRDRFGWLTVGIGVLGLLSVQFAMSSGEALEESVGEETSLIDQHSERAAQLRPVFFLLVLVVVGMMVFELVQRRRAAAPTSSVGAAVAPARSVSRHPMMLGLAAAAVVLSILSGVLVARTGHSGAKSAWEDVTTGEGG